MFRVSLKEFDRTRSFRIQHAIPEDDPLWEGTGLIFRTPVEVDLELQSTSSGQVVARGRVSTVMAEGCRRCLTQVEAPLEESLELVWTVPDVLADEEEMEGELRILAPGDTEIDLGEAIREELLLTKPTYIVCREDCRGLCPMCGVNRNEEECDCAPSERDPRWDALLGEQD